MAATSKPNGQPTRRLRRASYTLYNLDRHHNGGHPSGNPSW
jgi:hypothetical protein